MTVLRRIDPRLLVLIVELSTDLQCMGKTTQCLHEIALNG